MARHGEILSQFLLGEFVLAAQVSQAIGDSPDFFLHSIPLSTALLPVFRSRPPGIPGPAQPSAVALIWPGRSTWPEVPARSGQAPPRYATQAPRPGTG